MTEKYRWHNDNPFHFQKFKCVKYLRSDTSRIEKLEKEKQLLALFI